MRGLGKSQNRSKFLTTDNTCRCPYCDKAFKSWGSVRSHISSCALNSREYYISEIYGPIEYQFFNNKHLAEIQDIYPSITDSTLENVKRIVRGIDTQVNLTNMKKVEWTKETCIDAIHSYVDTTGKIPSTRECKNIANFPSKGTIYTKFGSWNKFIEEAGFEPSIKCGYGKSTMAADGVMYRSGLEAYFVDNYLFNKYDYVYEQSYPTECNLPRRLYDFYIPSLDLYIEIAGGLRDDVIQLKVDKAKKAKINLLVCYPRQIYSNKYTLAELINQAKNSC